ncbi:MAG: copper resistance protein B [Rhodanobacteraceae bacterium]
MSARPLVRVCALLATCAVSHTALGQVDHAAMHGSHPPSQPATHEHPPSRANQDEQAETDAKSAEVASDHIPPPPPQTPMMPMSNAAMIEAMQMDDTASFAMFKLSRLERAFSDNGPSIDWKADAWIGGDIDKLWLRSEGEHADGGLQQGDVEVLWNHAVAPFWDTQLGVRQDFGQGPNRTWAAFGVQGLAPYWFDVELTAYAGSAGRTAFRAEVDYEILLTQRLILQPRIEINAYGKSDPEAGIGSGLNDAEAGLRLRYEIRREFAPYVGVAWSRRFGEGADFARAAGEDVTDTQWVVGVRVWF